MIVDRKKELDRLFFFLDLPPSKAEVKIKALGIDRLINGVVIEKKMEDTKITFKIHSKEVGHPINIEYVEWNGRIWGTGRSKTNDELEQIS